MAESRRGYSYRPVNRGKYDEGWDRIWGCPIQKALKMAIEIIKTERPDWYDEHQTLRAIIRIRALA